MYNDNKKNLKGILRVNSFYKKQGLRKRCKNCNFKLPKKKLFHLSKLVTVCVIIVIT